MNMRWNGSLIRSTGLWTIRLFTTVHREDVPGEWVFDRPFYLLLNLAVDYVRVYDAEENYEWFKASFVDDFIGWWQVSLPFADFMHSER